MWRARFKNLKNDNRLLGDMSIDNANALLWQRDTLPKTAFSAFKRAILQELSVRNGLIIGRTGKTGKSVKSDYIKALSDFISQLLFGIGAALKHRSRERILKLKGEWSVGGGEKRNLPTKTDTFPQVSWSGYTKLRKIGNTCWRMK